MNPPPSVLSRNNDLDERGPSPAQSEYLIAAAAIIDKGHEPRACKRVARRASTAGNGGSRDADGRSPLSPLRAHLTSTERREKLREACEMGKSILPFQNSARFRGGKPPSSTDNASKSL